MPPLIRSASTLSNAAIKSVCDIDLRVPKAIERLDEIDKINEEENEDDANQEQNNKFDENLQSENALKNINVSDNDEHNRTMVLQVGRSDLRLISPDRKIILLHKQHRDVSTCVQVSQNQLIETNHAIFFAIRAPSIRSILDLFAEKAIASIRLLVSFLNANRNQ